MTKSYTEVEVSPELEMRNIEEVSDIQSHEGVDMRKFEQEHYVPNLHRDKEINTWQSWEVFDHREIPDSRYLQRYPLVSHRVHSSEHSDDDTSEDVEVHDGASNKYPIHQELHWIPMEMPNIHQISRVRVEMDQSAMDLFYRDDNKEDMYVSRAEIADSRDQVSYSDE